MLRSCFDSGRWPIILLVALSACAGTQPAPEPRFEATTVEGRLQEQLPKVESLFRERSEKSGPPGLAVGVVYDGRLVWSRGFGVRDLSSGDPVTADTVFRIGSVTKLFTGLALLQLRDAGKLRLDDPVVTYLPEIQGVVYPTTEHPPILIRHMVTHSTGLPRVGGMDYTLAKPLTAEELFSSLRGLPLDFTPGSENRYSNLAMGLAGWVVTRASGKPYRDYVRERILEPLGMTETFFDESEVPLALLATGYDRVGTTFKAIDHQWHLGAVESAGGIYSSVRDLARFAALELSAWPPRDAPESTVLSRSSLRESQLAAGPQKPGMDGWGVNWGLHGDQPLGYRVWHTGGVAGYGAQIALVPDRNLGLITLQAASDGDLGKAPSEALALLEAAIPARAPVLGPPARPVLQTLLDAVNAPSKNLADLFAPSFLAAVPPERIKKHMSEFHQKMGDCHIDHILEGGSSGGTASLACAHGAARFQLSVLLAPPHLISGFYFFYD
jgi:CubicO group peptidase (beta-lactamase class C family)